MLPLVVGATLADAALGAGAEQVEARPAPPGVQVLRDLDYVRGGHERNRLDLYLPEGAARPLPVIVWVHGGGWTNGDKARLPIAAFATNGDGDKTVPISQSETFAQALKQAGAEVTFVVVKGAGHGGRLFTSPENLKQVEAFFRKHLTGPKPGSP